MSIGAAVLAGQETFGEGSELLSSVVDFRTQESVIYFLVKMLGESLEA